MISASPTGPATASIDAWPDEPIRISARMMPTTVPNRPTNGAVEPTVARKARPPVSFEVIAPWLRVSEFSIQSCWLIGSVRL